MLRTFADEFEADEYGPASAAFVTWAALLSHADTDGFLRIATEVMCWGDDHTPTTTTDR